MTMSMLLNADRLLFTFAGLVGLVCWIVVAHQMTRSSWKQGLAGGVGLLMLTYLVAMETGLGLGAPANQGVVAGLGLVSWLYALYWSVACWESRWRVPVVTTWCLAILLTVIRNFVQAVST